MDTISKTLTQCLSEHISASFASLDCLSQLVLGMLSCEGVKLTQAGAADAGRREV